MALGLLVALVSVGLANAEAVRSAVVIVIDGLSYPRLIALQDAYRGGLQRLLRESRVHQSTHHRHINTETSPGHASLSTGTPPSRHGVIGNDWIESAPNSEPRFVYAAKTTQTGPGNLMVDTLGDRLVERDPAARVFSLSGKDRSAIFMAGRNPAHRVSWWDRKRMAFVSSPAYNVDTQFAAIVERFNQQLQKPGAISRLWTQLDPLDTRSATGLALAPHQYPQVGLLFDHDLSTHRFGLGSGLYYSPRIDALTVDLAIELISAPGAQFGRRARADMLWLSLSGYDTVSHYYGPQSLEARDALLRVDRELGRLLEVLEARLGKQRLIVMLTADHGMAEIPEAPTTRGEPFHFGRIVSHEQQAESNDWVGELNRLLRRALCLPPGHRPLLGMRAQGLYYNHAMLPWQSRGAAPDGCPLRVEAETIDRALLELIAQEYSERIDRSYVSRQAQTWSQDDPYAPFVRNGLYPGRSADLYIVTRPGTVVWEDAHRGTHHGTPHSYDTHVPWFEWGADTVPGVVADSESSYEIAPALARRLGLVELGAGQETTLSREAARSSRRVVVPARQADASAR